MVKHIYKRLTILYIKKIDGVITYAYRVVLILYLKTKWLICTYG